EVDVPGGPVRGPGDVEQDGRVEDVRTDDLVRTEREDHEEREPEEDAAADGREPDDEPPEEADDDRGDLVAARELPVRVTLGAARLHEALGDQADRPEQEGGAEHLTHHGLRLVSVALRELLVQPDAQKRRRYRPDEHPAGETRTDVPHTAVLD